MIEADKLSKKQNMMGMKKKEEGKKDSSIAVSFFLKKERMND